MLNFNIHSQLNYGDAVYISGNSCYLGNWNPNQARRMVWTEDDVWTTKIPVHDFEYKYFIAEYDNPTNIEWEDGPNRVMQMKVTTSFVDVWNHRKVLLQCYNPQNLQIYISGSSSDLGKLKKRIKMKYKKDISYYRILVNILEEQEIIYQFHIEKKKYYTSQLYFLNLYSQKKFYKNYIITFCEGINKIKRSIYQLDQHICYGYVPNDKTDFASLKEANLKTIIEFQNTPEQENNSTQHEEFTYLTINIYFDKGTNYFKRLFSYIQLLIQQYQNIYLCNNSLSHLRKYLKVYEKFIISK